MDLQLDTDHDLEWVNGEIPVVDGDDEILQRAWIALQTALGEWAFDTAFGFPYRELFQSRGVNKVFIVGAVKAVLEPITGFGSIRAIAITHDPLTQQLTIDTDTIYGSVEATL